MDLISNEEEFTRQPSVAWLAYCRYLSLRSSSIRRFNPRFCSIYESKMNFWKPTSTFKLSIVFSYEFSVYFINNTLFFFFLSKQIISFMNKGTFIFSLNFLLFLTSNIPLQFIDKVSSTSSKEYDVSIPDIALSKLQFMFAIKLD